MKNILMYLILFFQFSLCFKRHNFVLELTIQVIKLIINDKIISPNNLLESAE